jgi:hypothetical protein
MMRVCKRDSRAEKHVNKDTFEHISSGDDWFRGKYITYVYPVPGGSFKTRPLFK